MFLALKEMKKEKGRFILIISIFVLISYLVYFLLGLANGLAGDNRTAVDQWNANQIVLAKGSNNNIASSMIDQEPLEEKLSGKDYELINLSRSVAYKNSDESKDETINITLIGMDTNSEKFPEIIEGNSIQSEGEIIASLAIKEKEELKLGDKLKLTMNGRVFKIVGFTNDYKFNVSPVIYTKLEESSQASMIYKNENPEVDTVSKATENLPKRVSAALIYTDENINLENDYDVIAIDKFISQIPGYYAQLLTFGLMIGFLIVIAAIVLGVFLYIITIQKKTIFGIMKIQGISNGYIGKSVIIQTFLISIIGLGIGLALTYATDLALPAVVPFKSNYTFNLIITLIIMITAQIGAFFSVRSVSKVDPLEVI